eukprot:19149-Heterococcus_DN1.PRE.1
MFLDAARYLDRGDSYYDFKMRVLMLPTRLTAVVRNVQQQIVMGLLAAIVCTLSYASAYVVSELVGSCNEAWAAAAIALQYTVHVWHLILYAVGCCVITCAVEASRQLTLHKVLDSVHGLRHCSYVNVVVWTLMHAAAAAVVLPTVDATILNPLTEHE